MNKKAFLVVFALMGLFTTFLMVQQKLVPALILCGLSRVEAETNAILTGIYLYKEKYGHFPHGSYVDICRAINGSFIEFPKQGLATDGSILDPWKTPYEIYFSSNGVLIRSAGKNKTFEERYVRWSDDFYNGGSAEQGAAANP